MSHRRNVCRRTRKIGRSAFTLLEVMLVLVIIAAIAGIAVFNLTGMQEQALIKKTQGEISVLKNALDMYKLNTFKYPSSLDALYEKPSDLVDESKWTQVMKEPIKPDEWGNPYEYQSDGASFTLKSLGPDGQSGTDDDIT